METLANWLGHLRVSKNPSKLRPSATGRNLRPRSTMRAKAKAEGGYRGRKPTARAKANDAVQLFRKGKRVAHIAKELGIGRGSVYRALEAAGVEVNR